MAKKPETILSEKVLTRLRAESGWWIKIHGGPFQIAGIPDIIGCWHGRLVAIELKVDNEIPTKLQKATLNAIHDAGGIVGVAYTIEEALNIRDEKKIFVKFKKNAVDKNLFL